MLRLARGQPRPDKVGSSTAALAGLGAKSVERRTGDPRRPVHGFGGVEVSDESPVLAGWTHNGTGIDDAVRLGSGHHSYRGDAATNATICLRGGGTLALEHQIWI